MRNCISLFVITVIFFIQPCYSQENSIWIAGQTLNLGMDKNQVIYLFKSDYDLLKIPDREEEYAIVTKKGPPYLPSGVIKFENNKLINILKRWGQFEGNNIVEFGNTLNNLISKLNEKGETIAIVKSSRGAREPNIVSNTIDLHFGNHKIQIEIWESKEYGNRVSIYESISK